MGAQLSGGILPPRHVYGTAPHMIARPFAALASLALLSGCATVAPPDRLAQADPLEKFNRGVWGVNQAADKVLIKPVTSVYRAVAPQPVRQGVSNFFANLTEPWSFINNLLQAKPDRAVRNVGRFLMNSTIGLGGLVDVASKANVAPAYEDFGQTLARFGVNGGPYLVLPLLGPSTLRDGIGSGVAAYADPVNVAINNADVSVWYKRGYRAAYVISLRSDLIETGGDAFLQSALDPYATARSAYLQRRQVAFRDAEDAADAGPPDDAAEAALTPIGDAASLPPSGATPPGDAPAVAPDAPAPSGAALPPSAAPMPGDAAAQPAAPRP